MSAPNSRATTSWRNVWQSAEITRISDETPTCKTFALRPVRWSPFLPGQHIDVRLTAEDGYTAVRSYSITSAPTDETELELVIQRLRDGEVSSYFHDVAVVGDVIEIRGPFTEHFVWRPERDGTALLVAGGSGVAPFVSMIRHRATVPAAPSMTLLYSSRTLDEVIYHDELRRQRSTQAGLRLVLALTRDVRAEATTADYVRRIDAAMVRNVLAGFAEPPQSCYVCGNNGFVGAAVDALRSGGVRSDHIRTERYGE